MKESDVNRDIGIRNEIVKKGLLPLFRKPEARRLKPAALRLPLAHALQRILVESLPEEEVA